MRSFFRLCFSRQIAVSALRVSLVVGTALNAINQGEHILTGNNIAWFHLLLNYFVPYCVASYSAARNQLTRDEDE